MPGKQRQHQACIFHMQQGNLSLILYIKNNKKYVAFLTGLNEERHG